MEPGPKGAKKGPSALERAEKLCGWKIRGRKDLHSYARQAPTTLPLKFGNHLKIDSIDVSDDFEQKKNFFVSSRNCPARLGTSRNCPAGLGSFRNCPAGLRLSRNCPAGLGNVQKLPRRVRKRPETAPQG